VQVLAVSGFARRAGDGTVTIEPGLSSIDRGANGQTFIKIIIGRSMNSHEIDVRQAVSLSNPSRQSRPGEPVYAVNPSVLDAG
jgi:hypothetical protein